MRLRVGLYIPLYVEVLQGAYFVWSLRISVCYREACHMLSVTEKAKLSTSPPLRNMIYKHNKYINKYTR